LLKQVQKIMLLGRSSQGGNGHSVQPQVKSRNGVDYVARNVQNASNVAKSNPKVEYLDYLKKETFGKVPT
jgi:hypothetical protein